MRLISSSPKPSTSGGVNRKCVDFAQKLEVELYASLTMAFSREYCIVVDFEKLAGYSMLAVLQLRFVGSNPTPRTIFARLDSLKFRSF
jgi:hypothetical protein